MMTYLLSLVSKASLLAKGIASYKYQIQSKTYKRVIKDRYLNHSNLKEMMRIKLPKTTKRIMMMT